MACASCLNEHCDGCDPANYAVFDAAQLDNTLIGSLTCAVDNLRNLYTILGVRSYQVRLIWTRWSGGARGYGTEVIAREEIILPTPLVSDLKTVRVDQEAYGAIETGEVVVSEISARYTEAELRGLSRVVAPGNELPPDINFFWEVFYPGSDGDGVRRRFTPKSAPNSDPMNFQWTIRLVKQSEDRVTSGALS